MKIAKKSYCSVQINELKTRAQAQFDSLIALVATPNLPAAMHACQEQIIKAFTYSDFISRTALRYPQQFADMLAQLNKPESCLQANYQEDLHAGLKEIELEPAMQAYLRQYRHMQMLAIAWHDIVHCGNIKHSLRALSDLADALIDEANKWLHHKACQRYGAPSPDQQLLVLGMGKLGGHELNFSSDIDLIFVYAQSGETSHASKPIEHQTFFLRLAQKLIAALHQTTVDGQVFRVDMRLRPLGDSGPLVVPLAAFESYYQEQGREWERFAMQKVRVINPIDDNNRAHIEELHSVITPFVYRKYLDFTTIESLRHMKGLIEAEVIRRNLANNIKLGRGGIREVEFFIQSLQLIHAGRITECQQSSILASFEALQAHGFLAENNAQTLLDSYLFLRKLEHYLQQFNDQQTQELPNDEINQARLAALYDCEHYADFRALVSSHMHIINTEFAQLVAREDDKQQGDSEQSSVFTDIWQLSLSKEEAQAQLTDVLLPEVIEPTVDALLGFKQKCAKHAIGERGQVTLAKLLPLLMDQIFFADKGTPEKNKLLLGRVLNILLTIVGRTAYLDLLLENPDVRQRLVFLCAKSVWISDQISQFPLLLDELLHPAYLQQDEASLEDWQGEYQSELRMQMLRVEPDDIEAQMDTLRHFKLTQQLRIAAADVTANLAINKVSDKLTILAEVILAQVIDIAWMQITEKFGVLAGTSLEDKKLAAIAYGKLGGIELGYGSDLDIVFVHDCSLEARTNGDKSVSCTEFYVKLIQRISHLFTAKTYLSQLYEIDLRLRPSGNSGLLISHLDSYQQYLHQEAWTWEHQALVRARCVYGTKPLHQAFNAIRHEVLSIRRDAKTLQQEVAQMRDKMRKHLDHSSGDDVDIKQTSGGIADLEFLVQFLVLKHSAQHQQLSCWSDNLRILDSLRECHVIAPETCDALQQAYLGLRAHSHLMSLQDNKRCSTNAQLLAWMDLIKTHYHLHLGSPSA